MTTGLPSFLLSLAVEYGGTVLGFVRKGFTAIRALLGSVSGLIRPLVKRALRSSRRTSGPRQRTSATRFETH